ncbi:hypothetical protein DPEC_G00268400 [Dallia pectoralis]|uniref:Uncharacterized protein n=1 Tax=Dallia pectoralis TaxID=75939 RepID=A0ACC2FP18_DALPE|nr:hypothetical protein DPEC_G00268400 [Dallia pectoralis]
MLGALARESLIYGIGAGREIEEMGVGMWIKRRTSERKQGQTDGGHWALSPVNDRRGTEWMFASSAAVRREFPNNSSGLVMEGHFPFTWCCAFLTYCARESAIKAQNALHEQKTLPGVSLSLYQDVPSKQRRPTSPPTSVPGTHG